MPPFGRLLRILTIRCEGATLLASRSLDEPLDALDRAALGTHCASCVKCRRARGQFAVIRDAMRAGDPIDPDVGADPGDVRLPPEAKERLLRRLRDHAAGN